MRITAFALLAFQGFALTAQRDGAPGSQAEPTGQEGDAGGLVTIELRVISSGQGSSVTIDRGSSDALAEGDLVLFHPRSGGVLSGTVTTVNRRSALVDLHDPSSIPEVGTQGEVRIPRERQAALAEERRAAREQREAEGQPEARAGARAREQARPRTPGATRTRTGPRACRCSPRWAWCARSSARRASAAATT